MNSTSGTTTVAPSGSAAATGASSWETVRADRDVGGVHPDQPGEGLPGPVVGVVPALPGGAPGPPVVQRGLQRVPGRPGRQAVAGGVQPARFGCPELACLF